MRKIIILEVDLPNRLTQAETVDYITTALSTYGGGLHPDDLLFRGIKVKQLAFMGKVYEDTP